MWLCVLGFLHFYGGICSLRTDLRYSHCMGQKAMQTGTGSHLESTPFSLDVFFFVIVEEQQTICFRRPKVTGVPQILKQR